MAKKSAVAKNEHRRRKINRYKNKRLALKKALRDENLAPAERFEVVLKLDALPKNSSPVRIRNRCGLTGRPRGYYRKFNLSRIALRELAGKGALAGVTKSSW